MAKGLFGGMTDYNHQSFGDILNDLEKERKNTIAFKDSIQANIDKLISNSYWNTAVPVDFKGIVSYAQHHYNTTISEFEDIIKDIKIEVKEHHIIRLKKISSVAQKINEDIGKIWHKKYFNKEYGDLNFTIIERIYGDTRDMSVNLLDTENIAERLNDFIGRRNPSITTGKKKKKWKISWTIGVITLIITFIGVCIAFIEYYNNDKNNKTGNSKIVNDSSSKLEGEDDIIPISIKLPFLENVPIIDKGIFIKYYYNDFLIGGVNIDTVKINARAKNGESLNLSKSGNDLRVDITKEPYIEIEYKGIYYSLETSGLPYNCFCKIKKNIKPTMKLRNYNQIE